MAWVKQILKGVEFTYEVINMMCFIAEEAAQTSMMAHSMALQNLKMDLAEEIYNDTMLEALDLLFEYWAVYALPIMPNSNCWKCFQWAFDLYCWTGGDRMENYRTLLSLGIDPRPGKNKIK